MPGAHGVPMPLSVACADLHAIIPTSEGDHMASPAAILAILMRRNPDAEAGLARFNAALDATGKQVPGELVKVGARAVHTHVVAGTGADRRGVTRSNEDIARSVLEAVSGDGWVRADDIDGLRDVPNQSWQAMHKHLAEARAQVERLRADWHQSNRDERRRARKSPAGGVWDGWYDGESFLVGWRDDGDAAARPMFTMPDERLVRVFVALLREINPQPARKATQ